MSRGVFFAFVLLGAGCGSKNDRVCDVETPVTYAQVAQVFEPNCLHCHHSDLSGGNRDGAPDDVNFNTYALAKQNANRANTQLLLGNMPLDNPGSVPDEQACLIEAWMEQGFPQ